MYLYIVTCVRCKENATTKYGGMLIFYHHLLESRMFVVTGPLREISNQPVIPRLSGSVPNRTLLCVGIQSVNI
jgi:hypothetical protein